LAGWAAFYRFTDFTALTFRRIDTVVFWKMAHWLAQSTGHASTFDAQMVPRAGDRPIENLADLRSEQSEKCRWQGAAPTDHKPEDAVPVAEPGTKSLHLQGRSPKYRHLSLS
jgi:hypothetical protein